MNRVNFAGASPALALSRAILIYENTNYVSGGATAAVATIHDINQGVIQPGRAISRASIGELSGALLRHDLQDRKAKGGLSPFIPPELVALDEKMMAWYCPSVVRPIYFKTGNPKLDKLDGKNVCHPNLNTV